MVCVRPSGRFGVAITTTVDGKNVLEQTIVADGSAQPLSQADCSGTQTSDWSRDGERLFTRVALNCTGRPAREVSGITMMAKGQWIDVQATVVDGDHDLRVRRYRRTSDQYAGVPALTTAPFSIEDVVEASAKVQSPAVEAALLEVGGRFSLNSRVLKQLADANVSPAVIDLMVAQAYPERFEIDRGVYPPGTRRVRRLGAGWQHERDDGVGWVRLSVSDVQIRSTAATTTIRPSRIRTIGARATAIATAIRSTATHTAMIFTAIPAFTTAAAGLSIRVREAEAEAATHSPARPTPAAAAASRRAAATRAFAPRGRVRATAARAQRLQNGAAVSDGPAERIQAARQVRRVPRARLVLQDRRARQVRVVLPAARVAAVLVVEAGQRNPGKLTANLQSRKLESRFSL